MHHGEANQAIDANPKMAGLFAYNDQRKKGSHERLLIAATELFCRHGYAAVSVEDITSEAGVSRVTYYRHFAKKSDIALVLFRRGAAIAMPMLLAIAERDWRDRDTLLNWLSDYFALNHEMRGIFRVLSQANIEDPEFSKQARPLLFELIAALGRSIPAFRFDPDPSEDQRRWIKAWLLIYTILDQANHAATMGGAAANPMMIEVLADSFLAFVKASGPDGCVVSGS